MKKKQFLFVVLALLLCLLFAFAGCSNASRDTNDDQGGGGNITGDGSDGNADGSGGKTDGSDGGSDSDDGDKSTPDGQKILVAYFSATNNTEGIAQCIQSYLKADAYEILAADPYTADDLKYYTNCRADSEQRDDSCRPEISGGVENMEQYGVIFVGYPIWHGIAPRIMYTFMESYDFAGKTIIPFCTSASSGMGSSATYLQALTKNATWLSGQRFSGSASDKSVTDWVDGVLPDNDEEKEEINAMYLYVNDDRMEVTLAKNSSAEALVEILKRGDITYEAHDYGDFEKVGDIGHALPKNDEPIDTTAGDVILYQGNNICLYYDNNSWTFTRIGRINGYSAAELRTILRAGEGNIQIKISLK